MNQLRFVPATGYTGSVEIPYVALNSNGTAIASGTFSLGVVNSVKKFSDVTTSTWCYKYVAELSDASVIAGYNDGTFKPNSTVTYGAALKLIMLAAGYPEQKPVIYKVQRPHPGPGQSLYRIASHAADAKHGHPGIFQPLHGILAKDQLRSGKLIQHSSLLLLVCALLYY